MALKYYFDIKSGHYKKINEAEGNAAAAETPTAAASQEEKPIEKKESQPIATKKSFKSIAEDPVILDLDKKMQDAKAKYDTIVKDLQNQKISAEQAIANVVSKPNTDLSQYTSAFHPSEVDDKIVNTELQIENAKYDYETKVHSLMIQKINRKKALQTIIENECLNKFLPYLNESKLNDAKIYLNAIFSEEVPEYYNICPNLYALKKIFKESNLICGKDKSGYFVLCVDQDDIDELTDILIKEGIEKDDIITSIIPQLCDRTKFLQNLNKK